MGAASTAKERKELADRLLGGVRWEVLPPAEAEGDIPVATHRDILRIGNKELECYILSDGRRIITEESMMDFFS